MRIYHLYNQRTKLNKKSTTEQHLQSSEGRNKTKHLAKIIKAVKIISFLWLLSTSLLMVITSLVFIVSAQFHPQVLCLNIGYGVHRLTTPNHCCLFKESQEFRKVGNHRQFSDCYVLRLTVWWDWRLYYRIDGKKINGWREFPLFVVCCFGVFVCLFVLKNKQVGVNINDTSNTSSPRQQFNST